MPASNPISNNANNDDNNLDLLDILIKKALKSGADSADAMAINARSISHAQRMGKMENIESSESRDLGLRVMIGKKQAVISSNDWNQDRLDNLVDQAISMAKSVPEDEYIGLANANQLYDGILPKLDSFDAIEPTADILIERAKTAENAALEVEGITNSEGAEASWDNWNVSIMASNGFSGQYRNSNHSVSAMVLAGEGGNMESDYDYSSCVHAEDLKDCTTIGKAAANRAIAKLNPRKGKTMQSSVVFDPRVSGGFAQHLASAINGTSIAKGTSFLKDRLNKQVMRNGINLIEDPHRIRGLSSKPFDAEGLANSRKMLIDDGILATWIMDLRTSRQLGMKSTGNAARGTSGSPSPSVSNLYFENGDISVEDLISDIKSGLYVTSMMGMGVNMITGDYSRGASGFWIENGKISYAVNEITVAGNLKDMFMQMHLANDLKIEHSTDAPTLRIDNMTIAGV